MLSKEEQKNLLAKAMFQHLDAHLDPVTKVQLTGSSAMREVLPILAEYVIEELSPKIIEQFTLQMAKKHGISIPKSEVANAEPPDFLSELSKI